MSLRNPSKSAYFRPSLVQAGCRNTKIIGNSRGRGCGHFCQGTNGSSFYGYLSVYISYVKTRILKKLIFSFHFLVKKKTK